MQTYPKGATGKINYGIDYIDWLKGDTLTASTWIVDTGIVIESTSFNSTRTIINISGGIIGSSYKAYNTITTAGGDSDCWYITINVIGCR
jgi:hypothetical protein